jgi:nucleoside-diphosphate-sugar epimerase
MTDHQPHRRDSLKRIFLAGASGVLGRLLVPLLVDAGHTVAGMTRTPAKADDLRAMGAEPVVCDVYNLPALTAAVTEFRPELVLHQLTDLPDDPSRRAEFSHANDRMRREGTRNLLAAARSAGCDRFLAQSIAWQLPGDRGRAVAEHERAVLDADGVVIRYGQFYGPDTFYPAEPPPPPRVRVDHAAHRTLALLDQPTGIVSIVDEPGVR